MIIERYELFHDNLDRQCDTKLPCLVGEPLPDGRAVAVASPQCPLELFHHPAMFRAKLTQGEDWDVDKVLDDIVRRFPSADLAADPPALLEYFDAEGAHRALVVRISRAKRRDMAKKAQMW